MENKKRQPLLTGYSVEVFFQKSVIFDRLTGDTFWIWLELEITKAVDFYFDSFCSDF